MDKRVTVAIWLMVAVACVSYVSAYQDITLVKKNKTVTEILSYEAFDTMFPHRNDRLSHAQGFYTYEAFLTAAKMFEGKGFGLIGGEELQKRELAAFFAHVAHETTCGWSKAQDGPYAWGLCYNEELSPPSLYCKDDFNYPCVDGVSYHWRGALPISWNFNYGPAGKGVGVDLLHRPDLVSSNATLAFATAIWYWMAPQKPNPSPHQVMVGDWTPSKEDIDAFRSPGFGMTTNILNGQIECGHGDDPRAQDRISHYTKFAFDILGASSLGDNLDCGLQGMLPFGYSIL